ncbi:hypothetical protein ELJ58_30200, partial [Klebsiella pneumoniae]|nr:hypothetical protein [Klebsiella pneumoniae]
APKTVWNGVQCVCPPNTFGQNCVSCPSE